MPETFDDVWHAVFNMARALGQATHDEAMLSVAHHADATMQSPAYLDALEDVKKSGALWMPAHDEAKAKVRALFDALASSRADTERLRAELAKVTRPRDTRPDGDMGSSR